MKNGQRQIRARLAEEPLVLSDGSLLAFGVDRATALAGPRITAALEEYRRFLLMLATAGQAIIPSPAVSAVWDLHRTDAAAYQAYCGTTLGMVPQPQPQPQPHRSLWREPAYAQTLALYQRIFGTEPPPELWPTLTFLRYEAATVAGFFTCIFSMAAGIGMVIFAGEQSPGGPPGPLAGIGMAICIAAFVLMLISLVPYMTMRRQPWPVDRDGGSGGMGGD